MPTRVDIIDSSPVYLAGLVGILRHSGFEIVGARTTSAQGVAPDADVIVVDVEAVAAVRPADFVAVAAAVAPTLVVTAGPANGSVAAFRAAGAAGVIDRHADAEEFVSAICGAARGGTAAVASVPVTMRDEGVVLTEPRPTLLLLSTRERQVLRHIARGLTHGQVARRLGISPHTVDTYVKRVRSKLDLGNKADLTRAAVALLTDMDDAA
jgi:DNA-binding NarL/FixJ family response regulator